MATGADKTERVQAGHTLVLRLTIVGPIPGLRYSLQNADGYPISAVTAGAEPLSLDAPVRYDQGRWLGELVRREGKTRRFVYIAMGRSAGDLTSSINGRAKIDIQDIPPELIEVAGDRPIEVKLPGVGRNGAPAFATLRPLESWKIVR
jgi:hypothetical protein